MKSKLLMLALAVGVLGVVSQARADVIAIRISGEITALYGTAPSSIHLGDAFTATYTYDSTITDSGNGQDLGKYIYDAPYGLTFLLGEYEIKTASNHTGEFIISLSNNVNGATDSYSVYSANNIVSPADFEVVEISWALADNTHTALASTELITTAPVLSQWEARNFFTIGGANSAFFIDGTVTEAVLIPEPLTITLLTFGAIAYTRKKK